MASLNHVATTSISQALLPKTKVDQFCSPRWPRTLTSSLSFSSHLCCPRRDGAEDKGVVDKRLLVIESEFGNALQAFRRQGNTLSQVLRSAWDGKDLEPLTKTSRIWASKPHADFRAERSRTRREARGRD